MIHGVWRESRLRWLKDIALEGEKEEEEEEEGNGSLGKWNQMGSPRCETVRTFQKEKRWPMSRCLVICLGHRFEYPPTWFKFTFRSRLE
ncbi:hypothetical protein Csa_008688 [Cucumis sativus]|uniref:Uncharacterized protein n=1 Tax=Cucumis sativus TaxID=3659 RepID=A0A0A0KTR3_CUCSA|nr:hypothetical protein Csa_008688 [Cucumis sativus]